MILLFYVALNVAGVLFFINVKKKLHIRLHILEIIVYWLVASYIFQNFSALCYMNFKTLIIPEKLTYEYSHVINRIVLFPMLMVTFLHFFLNVSSFLKKLLLTAFYILLLAGLEWLSHMLGVVIHVHWRVWWSFAFWLSVLLILIAVMRLFRKTLFEGELDL